MISRTETAVAQAVRFFRATDLSYKFQIGPFYALITLNLLSDVTQVQDGQITTTRGKDWWAGMKPPACVTSVIIQATPINRPNPLMKERLITASLDTRTTDAR